MSKVNKQINGFTLAEVLITLGIIGVVAALTIPALINKTRDLEFKSSFKKIYSQLDQVTRLIANDNNGTIAYAYNSSYPATHQCGTYTWPTNANCLRDLYANYMNVIEKCDDQASGYMSTGVNCWTTMRRPDAGAYANGPSEIYRPDSGGGLVLPSGANVVIVYYPFAALTTTTARGTVKIDVNGNKGPNVWGRDYFGAYITDNGLVPFGASIDSWGNINQAQACNQGGAECATKVILNVEY